MISNQLFIETANFVFPNEELLSHFKKVTSVIDEKIEVNSEEPVNKTV